MNKEIKIKIFELTRGYIGAGLMGWWEIWSKFNYDVPFADITGFIVSFGGLK